MLNKHARYMKVMTKRSLHNLHLPTPDAFKLAEIFIVVWTIGCAVRIMTLGQ